MRGYVSFLLVLAALAILVVLSNSYSNSKSVNFSKAISLERMEQLSLEAKRSMVSGAKYGALAGFLEYLGEVAASEGAEAFDPEKAKSRVRNGAYASMLLATSMSDPDYSFAFWCGEVSDERDLERMAQYSIESGSPQMCPSCQPIASPACKDYVDAEILADAKEAKFSLARVSLGSTNLGESPKIFGVTIYSQKFNSSKAAYIPTSENPFDTPYVYELSR